MEATQQGQAETNGEVVYTPAAAYPGFKMPEPVKLPSGAVFLLRRPQLTKMMRQGQIPNPLMEIVNQVFLERDSAELEAEAEAKGLSVEDLLEQRANEAANEADGTPPMPDGFTATDGLKFMDVIVWAAIVAPTVELEPQVGNTPLTASGALAYDAISDDDVRFILHWCNQEVADAATFPAGTGREGGSDDSGTVRPEAVRPAVDPA